jgi:hypothetical protein
MAVSNKRMLLDVVPQRIRLKHYSHRTEKSYVHWIRRFVRFHNQRHPRELGKAEIGSMGADEILVGSVRLQPKRRLLSDQFALVPGRSTGVILALG